MIEMAFKYINPGYISFLSSQASATEVTGKDYSNTGVAFTQTSSSVGFKVPDFNEGDDFWGRFDFYLPSSRSNEIFIRVGAPNFYTSTSYSGNYYSVFVFDIFANNSNSSHYVYFFSDIDYYRYNGSLSYFNLSLDAINSIVYHVHYNSSSGYVSVNINGKEFFSSTASRSFNAAQSSLVTFYSSSAIYFSNIIFSDEEISLKERAIALPISEVYTDMASLSSGIYVADAIDQTLLAALDLNSLLTETGANSQLTGIAVAGNPAYTTGTNVAALTALSKSGNNLIEHNTVPLSESESSFVMTGWSVENSVVADLQNMQVGVKAG